MDTELMHLDKCYFTLIQNLNQMLAYHVYDLKSRYMLFPNAEESSSQM